MWFIQTSSSNFTTGVTYTLGASGDVPAPADYDGDGKADPGVFSDGGLWTILQSTAGSLSVTWGSSLDLPLPRHP